jgi:hypothetical protein
MSPASPAAPTRTAATCTVRAWRWTGQAQALERLSPGGRFVLYTGSAILDGGVDALRVALEGLVADGRWRLTYEELDPDIFSGELRREAYADVERIAAVGAVIRGSVT